MPNTYHQTCEHLRSLLDYDPDRGNLTWKYNPKARKNWNTSFAGKPAGSIENNGYLRLGIEGQRYLAHRLIYLWMTGEDPPVCIDHINGNRSDNRWFNLRLATESENSRNTRLYATNTSGVPSVYWHKPLSQWQVRIAGKHVAITPDFFEACCTALSARNKLGYSNRWRD